MSITGSDNRGVFIRAAAVFLAALAVRAVFLLQWRDLPYYLSLCGDSLAYERWALEILNGEIIRHAAFYQSPFYPYFLAGFYKLFGHHPGGVLWLQAVADSLTCVMVMRIAERCFNVRAGLIAGLLCAVYRPFVFSAGLLGKETFAVSAAALFTLLVLRAAERGRAADHLLCGLAAGLSVLLRTNTALLMPAALLWLWLSADRGITGGVRRYILNSALPMLFGAGLAILPATLHNFAASRDFVPVNYNGGFTFFIGNNPEATGAGIYPAGFSSDPSLEETQPARIAEKAAGRALKPSEVSSFWFGEGIRFVFGRPFDWLFLTGMKFWFFWNWYEIPDNYDIQFVTGRFKTVLNLPLAAFGLIGCLGAAGIFLCRPREVSGLPLLLLIAYIGSVMPFWMSDRYRLPALVFLLPLAARAADLLAEAVLRRGWRDLRTPLLAALPLMLLCLSRPAFNLKFAEAEGWAQLVSIYSARGEHEQAVRAFRTASELSPEGLNGETLDAVSVSLEILGRKPGRPKRGGG